MTQRKVPLVLLAAAITITLGVALTLFFTGELSLLWRNQRNYEDGLICHVDRTFMRLSDGGDEETLECDVLSSARDEVLSDMAISIELPDDFVLENRKKLDSGLLYVHIPGGSINEDYIDGFGVVGTNVNIPSNSDIAVIDDSEITSMRLKKRQRRTSEQTRELEGRGIRTVMVFRVTTDDATPDIGATEIEDRMFSPTEFSFASQFDKCSFGELTFEPYDYYTPVTELYVPGQVSSFTERTILNAATRKAADAFGRDIWDRIDHAIFCMPDGTTGKPYIAYSGVGSFFSVYHNVRCAYPTTVMHEISHNIGLGHAFENGEEYGDETTIMGFSSSSKTGPSKCFNGQNIWRFGWFKNRSTMMDPFQGHQLLELAPFVDFDKTNGYQVVLIKVFDMHIVYNRAKGFNAETSEHQNKVTIVREEDEINSALLAVLDMKQPVFTIPNILGTDRSLHIQLCGSVIGQPELGEADFYTVSIGLDYATCEPVNPPTPEPTYWPTYSPTWHPTSSPTPAPTWAPTGAPTESEPSGTPTSFLPEIELVPLHKPSSTEAEIEETQAPNTPEQLDPSTTLAPTKFTPDTLDDTAVGAIAPDSALTTLSEGPTTLAILIASFITILISCFACACFRWNQRRLDEQKRNLRLLQYNTSNQVVKMYMQDPI